MADRESLRRDLTSVEEHSDDYTCGDGCCYDVFNPLDEEASRLREELERLWVLEDSLGDLADA